MNERHQRYVICTTVAVLGGFGIIFLPQLVIIFLLIHGEFLPLFIFGTILTMSAKELTPEQAQEMAVILDDFGVYYRNVLSDGKSRILRILNDDQKRKLDRLLDEQR